jgi:chromosome partitioning protein
LATFGIGHLVGELDKFKNTHYALIDGSSPADRDIESLAPVLLGVVFTQVRHGGGRSGPNPTSQRIIDEMRLRFPTFTATPRHSQEAHAFAVENLIPAAFTDVHPTVAGEFQDLAAEFERKIGFEGDD